VDGGQAGRGWLQGLPDEGGRVQVLGEGLRGLLMRLAVHFVYYIFL